MSASAEKCQTPNIFGRAAGRGDWRGLKSFLALWGGGGRILESGRGIKKSWPTSTKLTKLSESMVTSYAVRNIQEQIALHYISICSKKPIFTVNVFTLTIG